MSRPRILQIVMLLFFSVGLIQSSACAPMQKGAGGKSASSTGPHDPVAAYQDASTGSSSQKARRDMDYHGELPYNGEPPGYFGSSGNSFSGSE